MLDILDAPVPYLLGLDAEYFHQMPLKYRPKDSLLVDLDRDVIHLGGLTIPNPPTRDAQKLVNALEEASKSAYIIPDSGIRGAIMAGTKIPELVPNENRPRYAYMTPVDTMDAENLGRKEVFSMTELAYGGEDGLAETISGFGSIHGQLSNTEESGHSEKRGKTENLGKKTAKMFGIKPMKKPKFMRNKKQDIISNSNTAKGQGHLLDTTEGAKFVVHDIRRAFLRYTVTLFTTYEQFLSPNAPRGVFSDLKFVDDLNLDSASMDFLKGVVETQLFQHFLQEREAAREGDLDIPEIKFFDESVTEKMNRSKKVTMANGGKKKPTPFLDTDEWKITKTFQPPPPNNLGLPDSEVTYSYGTFPPLDPSLFGRIRRPSLWRKTYSGKASRFALSSQSSKVKRTQNDIVRRALKTTFVTAPSAIMSAAGRTARDLESALAVVSTVSGLREKKDSPSTSASAKKNAKLKKTVSTCKLILPRTLFFTSFHYSSSNCRRLTIHYLFSAVVSVTKADMIMMNARRKQIILLDVIIKIQACCRGFLVRQKLKGPQNIRATGVFIGNEEAEKAKKLMQKKHEAAIRIQQYQRCFVAKYRWTRIKWATTTIQKKFLARRTANIYNELRRLVSVVQARVRGVQTRRRVGVVLDGKMARYKRQIFCLWNQAHVPLILRTKLWPDYFNVGHKFLRLRLAEGELVRLWALIGFKSKGTVAMDPSDDVARLSVFIGMNNAVYFRSKQCDAFLKTVAGSSSPKSDKVSGVVQAEEAERLQIYERLREITSEKDLSSIYRNFNFPPDEKFKKMLLAKNIWTKFNEVENSVSTMNSLFPELLNSFSMKYQPPSLKGHRRFNKASKAPVPPIDQKFFDKISVEGNVKKHVQEVAMLYITKVPSLMSRLDKSNGNGNLFAKEYYRRVIQEVYGTKTWTDARRIVIRKYLDGRNLNKTNSNVEVVFSETVRNTFIIDSAGAKKPNPFDDTVSPVDNTFNPFNIVMPDKHSTPNPFDESPETNGTTPKDTTFVSAEFADVNPQATAADKNITFPEIDQQTKEKAMEFPDIELQTADSKSSFPDIELSVVEEKKDSLYSSSGRFPDIDDLMDDQPPKPTRKTSRGWC